MLVTVWLHASAKTFSNPTLSDWLATIFLDKLTVSHLVKKLLNIVWKPDVRYHVHKTTPLDSNPSQTNRLNTHFVIILSLRLGLPSGILPPVYQTCLSLQREDVLEVYKVKTEQFLDRAWGLQNVETPRRSDSQHREVVRVSAQRTGLFYSPRDTPGTHLC